MDRLPPLNWLRAFEAAARHLSFTEAGRELHITQSAVSQQVKSLEGHLRQHLFLRRPRSLQLTDAGRAYLPTIEAAFKMLREGTRALTGENPDTLLDIHANLAFTVHWLMPRMEAFLAAHPWVKLNLSTSVWTTEHTDPYASVEIRFGAGRWDGAAGERLTKEEFFPVCAPTLSARLRRPLDLLDQRLMDVSGSLQGWDTWLAAAGLTPPIGLSPDRASTYVVTFELARQGLVIALGHGLIADNLLSQDALVRPFDLSLPMKESYYLVTPQERPLTSAAEAFRDWLLDTVRQ